MIVITSYKNSIQLTQIKDVTYVYVAIATAARLPQIFYNRYPNTNSVISTS